MNKKGYIKAFAVAIIGIAAAFTEASAQTYKDTSIPVRDRAALVLKELTLDEKIAMMMDDSPAVERLGIKRYNWWNEALHGIGRAGYATVFPQAIGMAATFDDSLLYEIFNCISDEARAKFNTLGDQDVTRYKGLTFWTPNVNIFRDPRWGRGQETYGEDPYLSSMLGKAAVEGLQGPEDARHIKTIACAKHYAVHSGPEWNRHSFDARDIDPRDLWETYLPAFKTLVDANVGQVMCAYNRVEGEPCCSNKRLLHDILRNKWGYDKIVVSDCWAIRDFYRPNAHATHPSAVEASADAVISGTDLECGSAYQSLREAYDKGFISEEAIDQSLLRLLEARLSLGELFDDKDCEWNSLGEKDICSRAHRELALNAARKSMTLLKNNGILPLSPDARITVMGPNANDTVMQWGNYNGFPTHTTSILSGIREIAPDVLYLKGCDHVKNNNTVSTFGMLSSGAQKGISATYWNNTTKEGNPVATELINFPINKNTGGATVFAPGVNLEDFSATFSTTFTPEESGEYIINMTASRGLKGLKVNGERVAKSYGSNPTNDYAYAIQAEKGKTYDIEIDWVNDRPGIAVLKFDIGRSVEYDTDCSGSDIVIFAGGISAALEGEEMPVTVEGFRGGDRTSIELPKIQRELIRQLKDQGKKIVFINCSGSAMGLLPEDELCDAVLQVWYPGEAGGQAVAETLFGINNPAGRLPVTFYKDDSQLPDFEDYDMAGRTYRYMTDKPLYAFGHGLSYTTFDYSSPSATPSDNGNTVKLNVNVRNSGDRDGDEVVQVYIKNPADRELNKTLRAFRRIHLKKGEDRDVTFELGPEAFAFFNPESGEMQALPGVYRIEVGSASDKTKSIMVNYQ
ncbi:MAG: glycoside hydrolase family 3 C-terminal domain-containing protein [Muribaculaceae bacterium]|nr:glycoside hydrolase family 3 C-terminal domain-containing protein [Muribaculaceae bacterium]